MRDEVIVSVQCITYNHEKYIRKALDGFVMQKTDFKFEVIVHDDASTDGTAKIVQEYAEKYDFIIPIFQKENQYSKGVPFAIKYIHPLMKGKYIAFCEGDDYWTDPYKLQTLYDYMSMHDECSMCCHAYESIEANSETVIREVHTLDEDGTISVKKAIQFENHPQLASQMFKRECVIDMPAIFLGRGIGDYTLLLYAATLGEMHYINRIMARYRVTADGSWTNRVYNNRKLRCAHFKTMISFLHDYDKYTSFQFHDEISDKIDEYNFGIMIATNDFKSQMKHPAFHLFTLKRKILILLGLFFPTIVGKIIDRHEFH